jgi:hypothetical protein
MPQVAGCRFQGRDSMEHSVKRIASKTGDWQRQAPISKLQFSNNIKISIFKRPIYCKFKTLKFVWNFDIEI